MKPILFDVGPLLETHWTGIPVFTARLASILIREEAIEPIFLCNGRLISFSAVQHALKQRTGLYMRSELDQAESFSKRRFDATHALYPTVKPVSGIAKYEASVVHDLSTILMPEYHMAANVAYHNNTIVNDMMTNDRVFTASDATALGVEYYLGVDKEKIRTAYQYVDWPDHFESEYLNVYRNRDVEPYILVLGTLEPRKNLSLILSSASLILEMVPHTKIVILGKEGWLFDKTFAPGVQAMIENGQIVFSGFVDEFQKYCLLNMASMVIYPSTFEGFGIPVLEAMSLGKEVLCSFSSSIPEVGSSAVHYFDPFSSRSFAENFEAVLSISSNEAQKRTESIKEASRAFSPDRFFAPFRDWLVNR